MCYYIKSNESHVHSIVTCVLSHAVYGASCLILSTLGYHLGSRPVCLLASSSRVSRNKGTERKRQKGPKAGSEGLCCHWTWPGRGCCGSCTRSVQEGCESREQASGYRNARKEKMPVCSLHFSLYARHHYQLIYAPSPWYIVWYIVSYQITRYDMNRTMWYKLIWSYIHLSYIFC